MDTAARLQMRTKPLPYLDRDRAGLPDDSSGESESSFVRRKFQRTATDPDTSSSDASTFRKPTLPASATRGVEGRTSFTQRRRSTLRENARVPSGPREFPSPSSRRNVSSGSNAPSMLDSTNTTSRSFLPQSSSESLLSHPALSSTKAAFSGADVNPPRPVERTTSNYEFLPDINFDDFQTSLQNYEGHGPVLREFSGLEAERKMLARDMEAYNLAKSNGRPSPVKARIDSLQKRDMGEHNDSSMDRTSSLRQRLGTGRQTSGEHSSALKGMQQGPSSSARDRRKSALPPSGTAQPTPMTATARPPRRSVGPGLLPGSRKVSGEASLGDLALESNVKAPASRTDSLKARRTTMQPSLSSTADLPRISTLTATTQARANKVKSLQPPPRESQDLGSPSAQKTPKPNTTHNRTPSSSGSRRPSDARSGRASGLGARTISPTDARRLKRQSMAAPPPMPGYPSKPIPATTNEISTSLTAPVMPELPRLTQPSPSLIPRKTSTNTPSSASPEGRQGYPGGGATLNSKSSFSSLTNVPSSGSTTRLPTPRGRLAMPSGAALPPHNNEQYTEADLSEEIVPPVPAIPKAYESPKDVEVENPPFFSTTSSLKSPQSTSSDPNAFDLALEFSSLPSAQFASTTPRSSLDAGMTESPRKRSGEFGRPMHRRNLTGGGGSSANVMPPPPTAPPKPMKTPSENSGRQIANRQPLRLPPLNMAPIRTHNGRQPSNVSLPRPTEEVENRDDAPQSAQTPEPRRVAKTPSTPMTASKATSFFRRQEERANVMRSSSSHFALRDVLGTSESANLATKFWDDSDVDGASGMPVPELPRNAITPFASGSLPKGSGEFARLRGRTATGEDDEFTGAGFQSSQRQSSRPRGPRARAQTGGTISSINSNGLQTPSFPESPVAEAGAKRDGSDKKDKEKEPGSAGGLRRKLSLGWRRSNSKNANHADHKGSPRQQQQPDEQLPSSDNKDLERSSKLKKRTDMPPPLLPASATWSGDLPSLPASSSAAASSRPSLDTSGLGHFRRKSVAPPATATGVAPSLETQQNGLSTIDANSKPTRLHSEQPQPVKAAGAGAPATAAGAGASTRSTSWGNLLGNNGALRQLTNGKASSNMKPLPAPRNGDKEAYSVLLKDKDDLLADEEMHRLSRKRKDVDTAARESEDLRKRAKPVSPMSAEQVLHDRSLTGGSGLNIFERGEVVDYQSHGIYFTGSRSARKVIGALSASPQSSSSDVKDGVGGGNNFGYDDERGDYNIVMGDHLAYRYEVVDMLGKGSFGQVVRCVDHKEGCIVAVKIIRNKRRFHQQALVEVGILGKLREWDPDSSRATLSITGSFYFRNHLCIVTPCLSINLYELIRAHNFVGFQLPLIRRFARQLLACLTLLQTKKIIHCDLKPENILLCDARKADVRVIDFGSSCNEAEKVYTYIQSRFYRSPEVILGSSYGMGIDMWSLGCILAELWTGYPLFPGENEQEQLACIMEIFGPPDRHLVDGCSRKKLFFDSVGKPRVTVSSKGRRRRPSSKTLAAALKTEDEAFIDFIARCLRWDPDRRLKPADAMSHPFITNQPFTARSGIPDEGRRTTRSTRPITSAGAAANATTASSAATTATTSSVPSPVKRSANAFAQQTASASARAKPPSQTSVHRTASNLPPSSSATALPAPAISSSPLKPLAPPASTLNSSNSISSGREPSRRHSTIATASAAAMAGSKRASNAAFLTPIQQQQQQQYQQQFHHHSSSSAVPTLSAMGSTSSLGTPPPAAAQMYPPPPPSSHHLHHHQSPHLGFQRTQSGNLAAVAAAAAVTSASASSGKDGSGRWRS